MELTIRMEDLLRGHGVAATDEERPRDARPEPHSLEALCAGILDAALTRNVTLLRAYGARMAEVPAQPSLDASLFASSAFE